MPNSIGLVGDSAVSANNAWAVGSNSGPVLIELWNGFFWKIVANPPLIGPTDFLNSVARVPATSMVWAVEDHYTSTNKIRTLTAFHC
ncbi:MAG: hypothetical protein M3Y76_09955 [Chloroflexota bacterium]|nr:hypothetical protein [Chloroflexota bacterium]